MSSSIVPSTTATAAPSVSPTQSPSSGGGGSSGPQSSPLLFFVALGFGVVFTNLWIIVGVKYCFRYNARNRPRHDENGDPIDLAAMPRQHRRRREKKLMSLDEVNERFPITKYKTWVSSRAEEGLPTAGGVAAPASRPASIKEEEVTRLSTNLSSEEHEQGSSDLPRPTTAQSSRAKEEEKTIQEPEPAHVAPATEEAPHPANPYEPSPETPIGGDDVDEDDPIHAAVPAEMLANPGDSCAICIDTLEDDDDVRGLTCGHAFHASCVDPWLTSRRACCPLCKADYYVPKPRPEGEQNQEPGDRPLGRRTSGRVDMNSLQGAPALTILTGRREGRSRSTRQNPRYGRRNPQAEHAAPTNTGRFLRFPRFSRRPASQPSIPRYNSTNAIGPVTSNVSDDHHHGQHTWTERLRPSIPRPQLAFWRRNRNGTDGDAAVGSEPTTTPGQLEAGAR